MLCQAIPTFLIILLLTDAYSDINFEKVSMKIINDQKVTIPIIIIFIPTESTIH